MEELEGIDTTKPLGKEETARRKQLFQDYMRSPEYQEFLIQRMQINDACNKKPEARGITWNLCARPDNLAEGCIFFIENFGWTFDPRPQADPMHLPFKLFEYQKDTVRWLIDHIEGGNDGLLEKSRDMGMSWIIFVMVPIWYWLFKDGTNLLLGSYKQDLVDNRSKDSLFGMIDYVLDSLPKWLLPKGFNKDKHRNQMKLTNPVNYNLIAGDTMNPDFGRGMRKTAVLFDELGTWDYSKDAWEGAGQSTACRIANSTPKGYNFYAQLRYSGIDVLTIHWSEHPLKDQKWYEYEKSRNTEEAIAQELDISYNKSQEGRVYSEWNEVNIEKGLFEYDHNLPLYVGWDFGRDDDTAIIWCQPYQGGYKIIDAFSKSGKLIDYFIPFITGLVPSDHNVYTPSELEIIERHKYWNKGTHFGDPAGRFHNQVSNETVISTLKQSGIVINFQDRWKEFSKRKTAAKLMIRDHLYINKNAYTDYFNICLSQAAYPKVKSEGLDEIRSQKPIHNWTAHHRSAFEYLALGLKEFTPIKRIPYDKFQIKKLKESRKVLSY